MGDRTIRILLAKPDLDGHDRGAKVVALALRDAGMEVFYTGLHQSVDKIVSAAIQESVHVIGLSVMAGGHLPICREMIKRMKEQGMEYVHLIIGGVIPKQDIPELEKMGVRGVFPSGTSFDEIVKGIEALFDGRD
ncbi:MAG: cobalamin B12-binding domain-containing protein [Desulfobacterales bacterium]|nr:cobalamin B12-binding domain-containing protein [Desulfobacterales bacterium]